MSNSPKLVQRGRVTRSMTTAVISETCRVMDTPEKLILPDNKCRRRRKKADRLTRVIRNAASSKQSRHPFPSTLADTFPLIQESIVHNLYYLVIQAMLWNQTSGRQARPIFLILVERYPDPESLAQASLEDLTTLLRPLGLHNQRARRCIALGRTWLEHPPTSAKRYRRKGYPLKPLATDPEDGWEIAHLPGVGPYSLDSFRIFHRDEMRGLAKDWLGNEATEQGFEPEWKRVLPLDKELRAYLKWRWLKEGFVWNEHDGTKVVASKELLSAAEQPSEKD